MPPIITNYSQAPASLLLAFIDLLLAGAWEFASEMQKKGQEHRVT